MAHRPHVSPALEVHGKNSPTRLFGLDRDVVRIGRDAGSELAIDDQRVSRSHAQVVRRSDGFYVEDLGSHNLTYLDDLPLAPNSPALLRDGSRIGICDHQFIFRRAAIVIRGESSARSSRLEDARQTRQLVERYTSGPARRGAPGGARDPPRPRRRGRA